MTPKKKPKPKSKPKQSRETKIWELARLNKMLRDGELELDLNARISEGDDNGAYIETWMWVPFDGTPLDKGEPPGPKDWSPIRKKAATHVQVLDLARESSQLHDGELELDTDAKVSESDSNGAYVQTWMWVDFHNTYLDKES